MRTYVVCMRTFVHGRVSVHEVRTVHVYWQLCLCVRERAPSTGV